MINKLLAALLFLCASACAQVVVGNGYVQYVWTAPSGSCGQNAQQQDVVGLGTIYTCQNGTWTQISAGGSGTVTSVTGTTNQIDVATGTTTPVISLDAAISLPGSLTAGPGASITVSGTGTNNATALNGTALSGLGTGILKNTTTTGVPSIAASADILAACTTCVTSASSLTSTAVMTGGGSQASQTPSATATLDSSGNLSLPGTLTVKGTSAIIGANSGNVGLITVNGSTSGSAGITTTATGTLLALSPNVQAPDNAGYGWSQTGTNTGTTGARVIVDGSSTTEAIDFTGGTSTGLTRGTQCRLTATVTMNTTGVAVTFCTWTLPNAALTWAWQCHGTYTTSTSSDTFALGYTVAQTPTGVTGNAIIYSTLTGTSTAGSVTSTTATTNQTILTGASVSSVTNEPFMSSGVIQAGATSGTFVLTGALTGTTPSGTINPGTTCQLY